LRYICLLVVRSLGYCMSKYSVIITPVKMQSTWHQISPWSTLLLEKLTVPQLVKKFPAFYGARGFSTAFTSARQLSLSWARSVQSMHPHYTSWRRILMLSSFLYLRLPSGPFLTPTKTLYAPLLFPKRATFPAHLVLLDLITGIIFREEYKSKCGPGSSVGIATDYGLNGPGSNPYNFCVRTCKK